MKNIASKKKSFVVGRKAAVKMCAVEGIHLSQSARVMFHGFDEKKLTPTARRQHVLATAKRKAI